MNSQNSPTPPEEDVQASTSLAGSGVKGDFPASISGSQAQFTANEAGKLQAGELLGDYEIMSLLGVGGMGFVYKVRHRILQKVYALKTLNHEQVNETAWRRLQLEAQAIARMSHPNIIGIHNLGLHNGVLPFYVMDLLEGENLADVLVRRGALSLEEALPIFIGVASGLGYAHKKGIIHRDIKPGNIFLLNEKDSAGSNVKLVDFGIAKFSGAESEVQNLTTAGEVFGSPYYMSPEHCDGKRIDARSDIYSLGCTFFEILTGLPPFRGANPIQTMMMHQSQHAPSLTKVTGGKTFPDGVEELVATMLEKAPMDRYQSLEEVVAELEYMMKTAKSLPSTPGRKNGSDAESHGDGEHTGNHPIQFALKISLAAAVLLAAGGTFAYWWSEEHKTPVSPLGPTSGSSDSTRTASRTPSSFVSTSSAAVSPANSAATTTGEPRREASALRVFRGRPYRVGLVDDSGTPKLKFDFGADTNLGHLVFEEGDRKHSIEAKGEVLVPRDARLTLVCNRSLAVEPWLLGGFSPGDLWGLVVDDACTLTNEGATHVARLEQLKCLTVSASSLSPNININGESLRLLEPLTELRELELNNTGVKGSDFVFLSRLRKLKHLTFTPVTEAAELLAALAPNKNLTDLTLEHGPLTASDFKAISTCHNLRHLRVNDTKMTNDSMEEISALPHLKSLEANWSLLDAECLNSLKKMKSLKDLSIGGNKLDLTDTVKFSTVLKVNMH
ncbi:hypothetical protein BH11CYA1_BH11CYA1_24180 [soil metagenome]